MKGTTLLVTILLSLFISSLATGTEEYYTIQAASYMTIEDAERYYKLLESNLSAESRAFLRIELVKGFYTLRIGRFSSYDEAKQILPEVKRFFPDSIIMKAFVLDERIKRIYIPERTPVETMSEEAMEEVEIKKGTTAEAKPPEKRPPEKRPQEPPGPPSTFVQIPLQYLLLVFIFAVFIVIVYLGRERLILFYEFALLRRLPFSRKNGMSIQGCLDNPRHSAMMLVEKVKYALSDIDIATLSLPHLVRYDRPVKGNLWICNGIRGDILKSGSTVLVLGALHIPSGDRIYAEVFTKGDAHIGEEAMLRALFSEGNVRLARGVRVLSFIDADYGLQIDEDCSVETATTGGELSLSKGCVFRCLAGKPLRTYNFRGTTFTPYTYDNLKLLQASLLNVPVRFLKDSIVFSKQDIHIPLYVRSNKSIVTSGMLTIGDHSVINGYLKAQRGIHLGESVLVNGYIHCYGEVLIGKDSRIHGDITATGRLIIGAGVRLGNRDREVKIRCDGEIEIAEDVEIYGVVSALKGRVV